MKQFIFFAHVYTWCVVANPSPLSAQDTELASPNYVVIGAFAYQENAIQFTDEARRQKFPARFQMNPNRNLYYVYVLTTDDREYAVSEALKLRTETKYFDTWVYSGILGNTHIPNVAKSTDQDINPETGRRIERVSTDVISDGAGKSSLSTTTTLAKRRSDLERTSDEPTTPRDNVPVPGKDGQTTSAPLPKTSTSQETAQNLTSKGAGISKEQEIASEESIVRPSSNNIKSTDLKQASLKGEQTGETEPQKNASRKVSSNPSGEEVKPGTEVKIPPDQGSQEASGPVTDESVSSRPDEVETNRATPQESKQLVSSSALKQSADDQPTATQGLDPKKTNTSSPGAVQQGVSTMKKTAALGESDRVSEDDVSGTGTQLEKIAAPVRESTTPLTPEDVLGKNFYFYLFRADNTETIPGEVDAIDFEKSRKMGTYPANDGVKVMMAGGRLKHVSFVCQVFGYRKMQREFDPANPSEDFYLDDKGNLVIPFELVRLQKGDIAIMYNVFFFKDAAVMRPESRYEVNNLLELLVENPTYKIIIHGHTNGNASGKIIRMNEPGNFYSLVGTNQGFGSAKQLSEERAIVIREFLISSGISPERMQVKAWGGKKPIHDKHSVRAQENVRVEIEILSQ